MTAENSTRVSRSGRTRTCFNEAAADDRGKQQPGAALGERHALQ